MILTQFTLVNHTQFKVEITANMTCSILVIVVEFNYDTELSLNMLQPDLMNKFKQMGKFPAPI